MRPSEKILKWGQAILTIVGVVTVLSWPGQWIYKTISLKDAAAVVIPICKRYVFGSTDFNNYRHLRVNIEALNPVLNARVLFSDVGNAVPWGMYSDGLSDLEIEAFLRVLSTEIFPNNTFLTQPLPDLAAGTSTTLMMLGQPLTEEHCYTSHVTVTTTQGDIYHTTPRIRQFREFPSLILGPFGTASLSYLIAITIGFALLVRHFWIKRH